MAVCDNQCRTTNINLQTQRCPNTCNGTDSTAAVFEWVIAVIFACYIFTFVIDMEVARDTIRHERQRALQREEAQEGQGDSKKNACTA